MNHRRNLSQVLLFGVDNISSIAFGLLGSAFLARSFGPENLGRLSTIQASTAMLVFLATLGLDHYWVRELSRNRHDGRLIATAQIAQWLGWCMHLILLLSIIWFQGNLQRDILIVIFVAISTLFGRSVFTLYYFMATGNPKPIAVSAISSRTISLTYLLWGFETNLSYEWMVMYLPIQTLAQCVYLTWEFWRRERHAISFEFDWLRITTLLREARPIFLATAIFPIFSHADILVVLHFLSLREVGIYTAATRLLPHFLFLGHMFASAYFPLIVARFDSGAADYSKYTMVVARMIVLLSVFTAATISIFASSITEILYGTSFSESTQVLRIASWGLLFMLPAALYSRILILEGLGHIELTKTVITAFISISLNILLIPKFGVLAAAGVSVFSYFLADLFLFAFFRQSRKLFYTAVIAISDWFIHPVESIRESHLILTNRK